MVEEEVYKKLSVVNRELGIHCQEKNEMQMKFLSEAMNDYLENRKLNILDVCCGTGRLLQYLNNINNKQNYYGIDCSSEIVNEAKKKTSNYSNITIVEDDVFLVGEKYTKKFDISILYKTLQCLPDFKSIIKQLIKFTTKKIYITSPLYDGNIDFFVRAYEYEKSSELYTNLNVYSKINIEKFCRLSGVKNVKFRNLKIDFDLPESDNKDFLKTYTKRLFSGEIVEISGVVLLNWELIEIDL